MNNLDIYKDYIAKNSNWFYEMYNKNVYDVYNLNIPKADVNIQKNNIININTSYDIYSNSNIDDKSINIKTENMTSYASDGIKFNESIFYKSLQELDNNNDIQYKDSYLYKYLKKSNISTLSEFYNIKEKCILDNASKYTIFHPWICKKCDKLNKIANFKIVDSKYIGELNDSIINMHFIKFKRILESIKKYGIIYDRGWPDKNLIQGYFLIDKDKYKFIVTRGTHRIYAMKYLNIPNCLVSIDTAYTPIININNIDDWYFVKKKFISKEVAKTIFNHYMFD